MSIEFVLRRRGPSGAQRSGDVRSSTATLERRCAVSGVATVRLVRTMVMEWEPEADELSTWEPASDEAVEETEATIDELAVVVGRAREGRGPKAESIEELIFEPTF
jgi:hypothetical protein